MSGLLEGIVIGMHLVSLHSEPTYPCTVNLTGRCEFNNTNPGLYVMTPSGFTAGTYVNSYHARSAYAGWTWQTEDKRYALTATAVTGYRFAPLMLGVIPSARFDLGNSWSARVSVIPKAPNQGLVQAVHLSIERKL